MLALGIEERMIFVDKQSGKDFNRPSYQTMKRILQKGDLLYLDALDRLGRDYEGIIYEWKHITRNIQADIVVLENETLFDSRKYREMGDIGKLMEDQFLNLSYVAEQERKIKQRQAEGIALAKSQGRHLGRPKLNLRTLSHEQRQLLDSHYPKWKNKEITGVEFMCLLGLKKNSFYKVVREFEIGI